MRGNLYIPDNTSHVVGRNTVSSVSISGTTVMERTLTLEAYERSLQGFDFEVGYGFDIGKKDRLWIHGGYFSFDHSDTPEIAGPRFRLQYEWNDSFGLPDSTLAFGVEVQDDHVRESQTFFSLNWSIPFGSHNKSRKVSNKWRSIESRMMRPIIRDIDVVTHADHINKAPGTTEGPEIVSNHDMPLIDPATGQQVDIYFVNANGSPAGTGTQDAPMAFIQAESTSGSSDVIFLLNDDGDIDVSGTSGGTLTLKPYQQLLSIGDNTSRNVLLPKEHTLTVSSTAGRPTLTRPNGADVVTLLWNNTLDGITISGGDNGVYGLNVNNPTIRDVEIHSTGNNAIYLNNSSATVDVFDNRITKNTNEGLRLYNYTGSTLTATVRDNLFSENQDDNIYCYNNAGTLNLSLNSNDIANSITDAGVHISNVSAGGINTNDIGISIDQDTDLSSTLSLALRNNLIEYNGYTGVRLDNGDGTFDASINGNSIANNMLDGVYIINRTTGILTANLSNNTITTNAARGVWLSNDTGTLNTLFKNNTIAMNINDGLELDNINGGIFDYDLGGGTLGSAGHNSIFANVSGVDVDNDTGASIKAENNWWGIAPPNPARFTDTVDFDPYLTSDPN